MTLYPTTYFVLKHVQKLLIARNNIRLVLDKEAECPESHGRLAIFLHDIKVRVIRPAPHLSRLRDDGVHASREVIL